MRMKDKKVGLVFSNGMRKVFGDESLVNHKSIEGFTYGFESHQRFPPSFLPEGACLPFFNKTRGGTKYK